MTDKRTAPASPKPKKNRSPAYPGIDLERAIGLAGRLYKQTKQHPAATEMVAHHWGMKPKNSRFLTAISAVRKFGLIESLPQRGPNSGHVKVSDLARNILLDEREGSQERAVALRESALKPEIHAELWRKYNGELPSDADLRFYLVRDLGFTESGAKEFIGEFRRTIMFAELGPFDVLLAPEDDNLVDMEEAPSRRLPDAPGTAARIPPPSGVREVPIPIQGAAWPALRAAFPLTEEAWTQMIAVLNAMKPGLVEPKKDS